MNKKIVLITGASSGIGLETAKYFNEKNFKVIATMRKPNSRKTPLHNIKGIEIMNLDVNDGKSIDDVYTIINEKYGKLDVLINNAGYALYGPFEAMDLSRINKEFNTNVIGLMRVTKVFLPMFRKQRSGTIINVSSMGGIVGFPFYSVYNSTKFAVEGFSESLSYELSQFNIRVKLVEPGGIRTNFYTRSMDKANLKNHDEYLSYFKMINDNFKDSESKFSHPQVIAKLIYRAAVSKSKKLRYYGGKNAGSSILLRKILPFELFRFILKKILEKR